MKTLTLAEFHAEVRAQDVPLHQVAVICPMCGTIQCASDLIAAGVGATFDEVEPHLGFSCIGRFTNAGPHRPGTPPGNGCDWTLGGLFQLHRLEVIAEDGKAHPRFELATPEQARAHMGAP